MNSSCMVPTADTTDLRDMDRSDVLTCSYANCVRLETGCTAGDPDYSACLLHFDRNPALVL